VTSLDILGCRLDTLDTDAATDAIATLARVGHGAQVVTLGTEMVVYAQHDPRFRDIVNHCALSLCDTVGLLTVARQRGARLSDRVTGVELVEHLCARAARDGIRVFLLGSAGGVAEQAAQILRQRYPGLQIGGVRDGYFRADETAAIVEAIRAGGAELLLVGMGSPRQEFWLSENLAATGAGAGVGIGGSLDVIAGKVERAPEAWRRVGLEWLYRLKKEPHRWRRQLALPQFVWLIALDSLRPKRSTT
jgi:N-acetylglucosaminyldiphosphoundecaprenol N-acetyl-beta-D-mannosaminyltransferase